MIYKIIVNLICYENEYEIIVKYVRNLESLYVL